MLLGMADVFEETLSSATMVCSGNAKNLLHLSHPGHLSIASLWKLAFGITQMVLRIYLRLAYDFLTTHPLLLASGQTTRGIVPVHLRLTILDVLAFSSTTSLQNHNLRPRQLRHLLQELWSKTCILAGRGQFRESPHNFHRTSIHCCMMHCMR